MGVTGYRWASVGLTGAKWEGGGHLGSVDIRGSR